MINAIMPDTPNSTNEARVDRNSNSALKVETCFIPMATLPLNTVIPNRTRILDGSTSLVAPAPS